MVEHRNLKVAIVLLAASALLHLFLGVAAGLAEDWVRMIFTLFLSVLFFFSATFGLVVIRLNHRLTRLEDRFRIDRESGPARIRHVATAVGILMVLSLAVSITLSIVAGLRGNWLRLGIYLTACAVTAILQLGFPLIVGTDMRLGRLEQLLGDTAKAEDA